MLFSDKEHGTWYIFQKPSTVSSYPKYRYLAAKQHSKDNGGSHSIKSIEADGNLLCCKSKRCCSCKLVPSSHCLPYLGRWRNAQIAERHWGRWSILGSPTQLSITNTQCPVWHSNNQGKESFPCPTVSPGCQEQLNAQISNWSNRSQLQGKSLQTCISLHHLSPLQRPVGKRPRNFPLSVSYLLTAYSTVEGNMFWDASAIIFFSNSSQI